MGTYIHGIAASENIDSSGERISIAGLDISSLAVDGVFNYEHKSDLPSQTIGKVLKAKKIFTDADCEDDYQLYFWKKIQVPYLYVMGELFDDYKESAKDVAGMFKYDADNKDKNERNVMNFSIEGAKIDKQGMDILKSIARKVTITVLPCNKAAVAEMVMATVPKKKDSLDNIFKSENYVEIELFKAEPRAGILNVAKTDPMKHAAKLGIDPMSKALTAGSGMAAPGQLEGGATLNRESINPKLDKPKSDKPNYGKVIMPPAIKPKGPGKVIRTGMAPAKSPGKVIMKSQWLARAEEEYAKWEKREQFEQFLSKRIPHLTKGEIKAIGQTFALKKALDAEKSLQKMMPDELNKGMMGMKSVSTKLHAGHGISVAKNPQTNKFAARVSAPTADKHGNYSVLHTTKEHGTHDEAHSAAKQFVDSSVKKAEEMNKALKFGDGSEKPHDKSKATSFAPPKHLENHKADVKGKVHTEIEHVHPHYDGKSADTVYTKAGHKLEGHPKGKFKAGDKVTLRAHIQGTHLLDHGHND